LYTNFAYSQNTTLMDLVGVTPLRTIDVPLKTDPKLMLGLGLWQITIPG